MIHVDILIEGIHMNRRAHRAVVQREQQTSQWDMGSKGIAVGHMDLQWVESFAD